LNFERRISLYHHLEIMSTPRAEVAPKIFSGLAGQLTEYFKTAVGFPGEETAAPASGSLFLTLTGQKSVPARPAEGFTESINGIEEKLYLSA